MQVIRHATLAASLTLLIAAGAQAEQHRRGPQDLNEDGQISRVEFDQWADEMFTKLDANGDQVLAEDEMPERRGPRGRRGRIARAGGPEGLAGRALIKVADDNADGTLENGEWQVFLSGLAVDGDGNLTDEALQSLLPPRPEREGVDREPRRELDAEDREARRTHVAARVFDTDRDGAVTIDELNGMFTDLDSDGDGSLVADELPSFERGGPRGRRGGRGFGDRR